MRIGMGILFVPAQAQVVSFISPAVPRNPYLTASPRCPGVPAVRFSPPVHVVMNRRHLGESKKSPTGSIFNGVDYCKMWKEMIAGLSAIGIILMPVGFENDNVAMWIIGLMLVLLAIVLGAVRWVDRSRSENDRLDSNSRRTTPEDSV